MSTFEAMVNAHLGAATRKQASLDAAAQRKQDYLDPKFQFNVNDARFIDSDTVELPSGEVLRLSGGQGRTLDSYEVDSPGATAEQKYAERPNVFEQHRQNYAQAYGVNPEDVTVQDLRMAGETQKRNIQERLGASADANGNIQYRARGSDAYNRTIAELDPAQHNLSEQGPNAAYNSRYNYEQGLADFSSGETAEHVRGAGDRSGKQVATDQLVNFTAGAGRMANDLVQGAGTLIGLNNIPGVDEGHHKVREALEAFKGWGNSPQQQRRERLEGERADAQAEFYNVKKEEYLEKGNNEVHASIRAGIDEFVDSVGNVIDNPGAILDKTVESLPYMLGVAGVGKAATTKALKAVQNKVLLRKGVQKNISKGTANRAKVNARGGQPGTKGRFQTAEALENTAAWHTKQFIDSKAGQAYLKKIQTVSGVTTVGLTEGLSTSADVYDSVVNMTEEQAANSEKYLALRNSGLSHEKAVEELAEDASWQTFLTVSLAAGAASWATGAGTFEAQLFTGLGRVSKTAAGAVKKTAADVAKKKGKEKATGIVKGTLKLGYRGTKAAVKHLGPGSAKEGAEELLQSGGGEFLSQLASFDATGEQVGPGVGRAAGEGAVIGAASGGLAELTFGSFRKLGALNPSELAAKASQYRDKVNNNKKVRNAVIANVDSVANGQSTVTDAEGNQVDAAETAPNVPTAEAVAQLTPEQAAKSFQAVLDDEEHKSVTHKFHALSKLRDRILGQGNLELSEKQQTQFDLAKGLAEEEQAVRLKAIYAKDEKDITKQDKAVLRWSIDQGFKVDTTQLPDAVASELETDVQLAEDFEAANETAAQISANSETGNRTAVQKVHDEKFGDVVVEKNGKKYFGLGYYNRRMRELMAVMDPAQQGTDANAELDSLMRRLKKFKTSQNNYLQALRNAIAQADPSLDIPIPGSDNKTVKYIAPAPGNNGGSIGLEALLTEEQEQFNQIRQGLINRYNQWSGSAAPAVRNAADRQANTEQRANQRAEQQTRKERKAKLAAESTPEVELRQERLQIKRDTKLGTTEQNAALLNLRKRVRNTNDKFLLEELNIDLKHTAKVARQNKKATREARKAEQAAAEEQRPDGTPTLEEDIGEEVGQRRKKQPLNIETAEERAERAPAPTRPAPATQGPSLRDIAEKGIVGALKHISQFSENKGHRVLAARILEVLKKDVEVFFISNEEMLERFDKKAKGAFVKENGKSLIFINKDRVKTDTGLNNTLLHEAIHAAINGYVKEDKLSPELKERLRKLNNEVRLALIRRGDPNDLVLAKILKRNPEELLTHGIATPYLQNFLRQIKVKDRTLWDKFVEFVADLLGVPKGSALGEVLNITEAVFQEVEGRGPVVEKTNDELFNQMEEDRGRWVENEKGVSFRDPTISREEWVSKWGWTVPTRQNLKAILKVLNGRPVVMPAAGFGLWAALLRNAGITVYASDTNPGISDYDGSRNLFTSIEEQDAVSAVKAAPADAVLFLSWPEQSSKPGFVADTLRAFKGTDVIYVGELEQPGQKTLTLHKDSVDTFAELGFNLFEEKADIGSPDNFERFGDAIYHVVRAPIASPEANSEPVGDGALGRPAARGEQEAEGNPDLGALEREQQKLLRLAEARGLRSRVVNRRATAESAYLTNNEDRAFLERLLREGVPITQAIEQLIARIEPNPTARDATVESSIPQEVIDQAIARGSVLNVPGTQEQVKARSFLETLWDFGVNVAAALKKMALGQTASDVWKRKSSKVRDLLASEDNIMQILTDPIAREQFFENIGTTPSEERALRNFAVFYTRFADTLERTIAQEPADPQSSATQTFKNPLYYFRDPNTGKLDSNVVGAMALEAMQYLTGSGAATIRNTDDDIRALLGLKDYAPVDPEARAKLSRGTLKANAIMEMGTNIFAHMNIALQEGQRPLQNDALVAALGAQTLLTLTQLGTPSQNGVIPRVQQIKISRLEWQRLKDLHADEQDIQADTGLVDDSINADGDIILVTNTLGASEWDSDLKAWVATDVNDKLANNIEEGKAIFEKLFGAVATTRSPLFGEPTMKNIATHVLRSGSRISKSMRERLLHDAKHAYQPDTEVLGLLNKFKDLTEYLKMAHEYKTQEQLDELHEEIRPGEESRNRGLENELKEIVRWGRIYGDRKVYLPQRMIRNGRLMIESNVLNPQTSKIHRFLLKREGWDRTFTKGSMSEAEYRGLMMAIGLGVGLKTDSLMAPDIISTVEAYFTQDGDWRDAMLALANAGDTFTKEDMEALAKVMGKEGTHTLAALNTAAKYFLANDGDKLTISLPHETDGVTNGYIIGLLATPPTDPDLINGDYRALLNAGGIYFDGDPWTNLAEYKAAGNLDNYQQIAQMTRERLIATFREAKRINQQTLVDYRNQKSIKDRIPGRDIVIQQNTQMVATSGLVPTGEQLQQLADENIDNTIDDMKVGREWAKDPLMVTSYGAGTGSTVRKVVSNAIETFYKELGKSQNIEELTFNLNRAYQIINMVVQANNRQNVPRFKGFDSNGRRVYEKWKQLGTDHSSGLMSTEEVQAFVDKEFGGSVRKMATEFRLTAAARQHLTTGVATTYGAALSNALDERLSPVKAVRAKMNAAMQLSNEMYVAEYKRQIEEIIKEKGVASHADKEATKQALRAQGLVPGVATAASSEIEDELEMVNYGHEYMRSGRSDQLLEGVGFLENPAQVVHTEYGVNGQVREGTQIKPLRTVTGRIITLTPNADIGVAAVVKAIHALDGVINSLVWGQGSIAVINVHDAQVSPWWAAEEIATGANSQFGDVIKDYNMLQSFLNSLNRIHGSLWAANDTRLTKEVRDKIALKMYAIHETHGIVEGLVRGNTPVEQGHNIINMLVVQMRSTTSASSRNKTGLMGDVRWINQFAQDGTEISAPNGLAPNTPTEWTKNKVTTPEPDAIMFEEALPDVETQLEEEFGSQFEFEKIESLWEALGDGQPTTDPQHQGYLRDLVSNLVKPGLAGIETLAQNLIEESGNELDLQMWENFQQFNQATAAGTLLANEDISLQERAAQEYVAMISYAGIQGDHFVRQELRRLYDLAAENITPASFLPADIVGDPAIAQERAQKRYDSIFNANNANEGYARFLAVGLTNKKFAEELSRIDNPVVDGTPTIDWNKGILGGMLSLLRQAIQKIAGVGLRYSGGNVQNAMQALAGATVAANQKNLQRLADQRNNIDQTSRVQKLNANIVRMIDERVVTPLSQGLNATHEKRLDPKNPTLPGFVKAATYAALKTRDDDVREHYNRLYREISTPYGFGKDNAIFGTMAEVLPWKTEDLNWIGLLRKSKYIVDMARQEMHDHTRSFLLKSFDPKNHISKAQKMALTNVVLKTDLNSLLDNNNGGIKMGHLAELLVDPTLRETETGRQDVALRAELAKQGLPSRLFFLFQNQARSLGNYMVNGRFTVENPMMNAHNIVQQRMLDSLDQTKVKDAAALEAIVDRMATMHALNITPVNDLRLANEIIQHEMAREDVPNDNGFTRLVGMHINFKELAKEKLFNGNPTQMIKGYVYEIFDGDVNIEYVIEGSPRELQLQAEGMIAVGRLPKDPSDGFAGQRVIYKGMRGLNSYNKSIVSLTDLQHRGANLFSTAGWQSRNALEKLSAVRGNAFLGARNQFTPNYSKNSPNIVPVLNEQGRIVDYRYLMNENNKRQILKKEDPFDRVLPRMMASITDRNNTQTINRDVINLLKAEYDALENSPSHRFVRVSASSTDENSKDMWNLLPEDMQRAAVDAFGFKGIYVRDDVANLVLGFRKATISNLKKPGTGNEDRPSELLWGKSTPVVRMAEKVWLEIVSLMRIKIAILTPAVVVGNIASNTAMLLGEGIPLNYIRKNASEAISSMRQYQKDRQAATELSTQIGSARALGKNTRAMEARLNRLEANLAANPVAQLVADGLFTSITADLGVDDDTIRGSMIQKAEDALGNKGGKYGQAAAGLAKELYMLPGSKGYKAAVAATQYGDFVARYVKFKHDTQVKKMDREQAINDALAAFIYYDIPQPKYLQALNDSGLVMFTKFFLRIQHIVARMYSQNPVSAFSVLALQKNMLMQPFDENIMNYGMGDGLGNKFNNPLNLPGKAWNTLDPTEPALLQWILNPFGL